MIFKPLALSSAAIIALSGVALVCSQLPASAADPEEQAVTRQLNSQQFDTPSVVTPGVVRTSARPRPMAPTPATAESVSLDQIDNPSATLMHRMVETTAGEPIGDVQHIVMDDEGRAVAVDVALNRGNRVVSIGADELVYDQNNDVLVTDMSSGEISDLPRI